MKESWSIQLVYAGGVVLNRHGYATESDAIREAHRILDCQARRPAIAYHRISRRDEDAGVGSGGGFYATSREALNAILWYRQAIHLDPAATPDVAAATPDENAPAEPSPAEPSPAEPSPPEPPPAEPSPQEPPPPEPSPDEDDEDDDDEDDDEDDGPPLPS